MQLQINCLLTCFTLKNIHLIFKKWLIDPPDKVWFISYFFIAGIMKLSLQLRLMLQCIEVVWRAAYISSAFVINLNTSIPQWIRLHPNLPYYRELTCFVIDSNISRSWKCHLFENKRYGFSGSLWKLQNLIAFMGDFDLSHIGSILGKAIFPYFTSECA